MNLLIAFHANELLIEFIQFCVADMRDNKFQVTA